MIDIFSCFSLDDTSVDASGGGAQTFWFVVVK